MTLWVDEQCSRCWGQGRICVTYDQPGCYGYEFCPACEAVGTVKAPATQEAIDALYEEVKRLKASVEKERVQRRRIAEMLSDDLAEAYRVAAAAINGEPDAAERLARLTGRG